MINQCSSGEQHYFVALIKLPGCPRNKLRQPTKGLMVTYLLVDDMAYNNLNGQALERWHYRLVIRHEDSVEERPQGRPTVTSLSSCVWMMIVAFFSEVGKIKLAASARQLREIQVVKKPPAGRTCRSVMHLQGLSRRFHGCRTKPPALPILNCVLRRKLLRFLDYCFLVFAHKYDKKGPVSSSAVAEIWIVCAHRDGIGRRFAISR